MADNVTVSYGEPIFVPVTSVNAISIIYEIVDEFECFVNPEKPIQQKKKSLKDHFSFPKAFGELLGMLSM